MRLQNANAGAEGFGLIGTKVTDLTSNKRELKYIGAVEMEELECFACSDCRIRF